MMNSLQMLHSKLLFLSILVLATFSSTNLDAFNLEDLSDQQRQDHIFFQNGGSEIDTAAKQQIQLLANVMDHTIMSNACIRLIGFSDATGGPDVNETISTQRAENVAELLRSLLSEPKRVEDVLGRGAVEFIEAAPPENPLQRRVRIEVRHCD